MELDKADVINTCWRVIEEMEQGNYADPEGKRAHFFSLSESEQYEIMSGRYDFECPEPRTMEDLERAVADLIVSEAIDTSFERCKESA